MNKKIFIHVGPPKTGTSAIQLALLQARDDLLQLGINYPSHCLGANGISSGNLESILSLDCDGKWQVSDEKVRNLLEDFKSSKQHTLILSSEYYFYLVGEIATLIPSAKFIAYIRCPLETFESSYNQSVKRHMRSSPAPFSQNLHTTTIDILSENIEVVGANRFILRAYLPFSVDGYNLVEDFYSVFGLEAMSVDKRSTNNSYAFEALEFKRWINQFSFIEIDHLIDEALQEYSHGKFGSSLLPSELFERYQKQALIKVRDFVYSNRVFNGKDLIGYMQNRVNLQNTNQFLSDAGFVKVCEFLLQRDPLMYEGICNALSKLQKIRSVDHPQRIDILLSDVERNISFISRLKTILNTLQSGLFK